MQHVNANVNLSTSRTSRFLDPVHNLGGMLIEPVKTSVPPPLLHSLYPISGYRRPYSTGTLLLTDSSSPPSQLGPRNVRVFHARGRGVEKISVTPVPRRRVPNSEAGSRYKWGSYNARPIRNPLAGTSPTSTGCPGNLPSDIEGCHTSSASSKATRLELEVTG